VVTTTSVPNTSTSTATNLSAPCTTAAAAAVLPGYRVLDIHCGGGWAAGAMSNSHFDAAYLLQSSNGHWVRVTGASVCTNGSIPPSVLDVSPCKVS
jgi:hypothetical protein